MLVGEIAVGGKLLWDRQAGDSCLEVKGGLYLGSRLCFKAVGGEVNEVKYTRAYGLHVLKTSQQLQNKTIIKLN
jgi:hypothetical protein